MTQTPTLMFCAGTVKSGTTWLYDYLRGHPETYLRSIKEVRHFTAFEYGWVKQRLKKLDQEIATMEADLASGQGGATWKLRQIADRLDYRRVLQSGPEATREYLDYLSGAAGKKLLAGEMTPEYGLLPVERIRAISTLASDVRWILLLRDPVSRLWSHVRMLVRRAMPGPEAFADACVAKFDDVLAGQVQDVTDRGDYAGIHSRLTKAVAPEKQLVVFYEHLMSPKGVARVTDFLGLSNHPAPLDKIVHGGVEVAMPNELRARAREWLRPQYAYVAATLGLPAEWESFPEFRSEVA